MAQMELDVGVPGASPGIISSTENLNFTEAQGPMKQVGSWQTFVMSQDTLSSTFHCDSLGTVSRSGVLTSSCREEMPTLWMLRVEVPERRTLRNRLSPVALAPPTPDMLLLLLLILLLGGSWTNNGTLSIRDVRKRDRGTYFFRAERGSMKHTYNSPQLSVVVTASKMLREDSSLWVLEGQSLCLVCAVNSNPPARMFDWRQAGSWPQTLILIQGALMKPDFLLSCGPTWIYHTRSCSDEVTALTLPHLPVGPPLSLEFLVPERRALKMKLFPAALQPPNPDMLRRLLLLPLFWGIEGMEGQGLNEDDYTLNVRGPVTVQEGLCVSVPCSFSYPQDRKTDSDTAYGYWFQKGAKMNLDAPVATNNPGRKLQEETQGRFYLLGDPQTNNCSLSIRDARKTDQRTYLFRVEKGKLKYTYSFPQLSVVVTDLTPYILNPGILESGHPRNLTCSVSWACEQGRLPMISWMGTSVSPQSPISTASSVLTLIPQPQDHNSSLTCQVTLPGAGVTGTRTIHLNVSYAPQNLTVTVYQGDDTTSKTLREDSSLRVLEGQSLQLVCAVNSNPPGRLSWTRGSLTLSPSQPLNPGVLELPQVHLGDEGEFTCRAQNPLGSQHVSLSLSLQGEFSGVMLPVSGVMLGVLAGAGATPLVFLSFCAIFIALRSLRRKLARPVAGDADASMEDAVVVRDSCSQGPQTGSQVDDSTPDQPPPVEAIPSSRKDREL
ncbi:sialic acid-binding Ig-like lectin 7 [Carlito syrichta]|uniref:Sialic acid-binding Ig-like lectin 7 n=1 Tax=Carlito syrichta TaxID=1868482 RepID=A0A3Q0DIS5_CARSF|nr:sialic acid-binding Ig-like lectin 7 [Carlito syrichta]